MKAIVIVIFVSVFITLVCLLIKNMINAKSDKFTREMESLESDIKLFKSDIDEYLGGRLSDDDFDARFDKWLERTDFIPYARAFKVVIIAHKTKSLKKGSRDYFLFNNYMISALKLISDQERFLTRYVNEKSLPPDIAEFIKQRYFLLTKFSPLIYYFVANVIEYPNNISIMQKLSYNDEYLIKSLEFLYGLEISEQLFLKHIEDKRNYLAGAKEETIEINILTPDI